MSPSSNAEAPGRRPRLRHKLTSKAVAPYLFILPNMVVFGLFTIIPTFNLFNMALYDSKNGRKFTWVGTKNFERIVSNEEFAQVALNTLIYTVAFVALTIVLATIGAIMLNDSFKGRGFFRAVAFLPSLLSAVVIGLLWGWIFDGSNGLVNVALGAFDIPGVGWLVNGRLAMGVIIFVGLWFHTGFYTLIMLSGLQGIDGNVYEAARVDGATGLQTFFQITWPLLRPTTFVVLILSTISGFQSFDFIWTLTGGGPVGSTTLMVQYIFDKAFSTPASYGMASAGAVVLFIAVFLVTVVNYLNGRRKDAA